MNSRISSEFLHSRIADASFNHAPRPKNTNDFARPPLRPGAHGFPVKRPAMHTSKFAGKDAHRFTPPAYQPQEKDSVCVTESFSKTAPTPVMLSEIDPNLLDALRRAFAAESASARPAETTPAATAIGPQVDRWQNAATRKDARYERQALDKIIAAAGWQTCEAIDEISFQAAIARIRQRSGNEGHDQIGARTLNRYIEVAKQFSAWLVRPARILAADPLAHTKKQKFKERDQRHIRRALTIAEFQRLYQAATAGPSIEKIPGPDRAALYLTAAYSGLRKRELGALKPHNFDCDCGMLRLAAADSKAGRRALQPIAQIAARLEKWLADRPAERLLWPISGRVADPEAKERKTAKMIKRDLEAAGIPYADAHGDVVDFHALRVSFITWLIQAGVDVKTVQELARHKDLTLTMNIYAKCHREQLDAAAEKMPAPPEVRAEEVQGMLFE